MHRFALLIVFVFCLVAAALAEDALPTLVAGNRVLFIGDSVTAGSTARHGFTSLVRQAWEEQRPDTQVAFSAIGCWAAPSKKLRDLVPKILADKNKPTLVIIYFGLNDANLRVPQGDYAGNLRFAVEEFRKAGIASAICTLGVWGSMAKTAAHSETARNTAKELGVPVIDLQTAFDTYLRSVKECRPDESPNLAGLSTLVDPTADGVHLGAIGNTLVATEVLKLLGLKAEWRKFPVTVVLGNVKRNLGYGPKGKGTLTIEPRKDYYEKGEKVTLTVVPDEGHTFHNWRGSIEGTAPTIEFTVDGPAFIEAVVTPPNGGR